MTAEKLKKALSRIRYNSPVILSFALASLAVLLLSSITNGRSNTLLFSVYRSSFMDPLTYVRAFLHVLGHSSFPHYFGNMALLLVIGPIVEEKYGSFSLLLSILMTALVSGAVHCLISSDTALLGASGIVFMLILLSAFTNTKDGTIPLTLILVALMYFGQEIYHAFVQTDDISQLAHIIGGICGILCGAFLNRKKKMHS